MSLPTSPPICVICRPDDNVEKWPKISQHSVLFSRIQCFYAAFTNKVSSQTSCIKTSLLPYAHHAASYSGYANIIAKLQDFPVKMSYEICISNKEKKHILLERFMRGWHLSCVNACKHVPLTPDLMSQALSLKLSTKLKSPKHPVPSPNQGHSTQPPSFSDPEFQLFSSSHMRSLNLPTLLPQILQLHTSIVSEVKISFFFLERALKFQTPLAPGCTPESPAFLW